MDAQHIDLNCLKCQKLLKRKQLLKVHQETLQRQKSIAEELKRKWSYHAEREMLLELSFAKLWRNVAIIRPQLKAELKTCGNSDDTSESRGEIATAAEAQEALDSLYQESVSARCHAGPSDLSKGSEVKKNTNTIAEEDEKARKDRRRISTRRDRDDHRVSNHAGIWCEDHGPCIFGRQYPSTEDPPGHHWPTSSTSVARLPKRKSKGAANLEEKKLSPEPQVADDKVAAAAGSSTVPSTD